MTPVAATLLMAALGAAIQLGIGLYFYGRLAQKVDNNEQGLKDTNADIRDIRSIQAQHGERITRLESWKEAQQQ